MAIETRRRRHWLAALCGLISVSAVFFLNRNFLLNHFLQEGGYLKDASLISGMIYEPTLWLDLPSAVRDPTASSSWYRIHISPTLILLGLPSHLISINFVAFSAALFAGITTSVAAVFGFLIWRLSRIGALGGGLAQQTLPMIVAPAAIAFSGPVMHAIGFPHFELLFAPLAALFFLMVAQRQLVAANLILTLFILTREDFAFHLFGFIFMWVAYQKIMLSKSFGELRLWLIYMAVAAAAGLALLAIQRILFPDYCSICRVYLGSPAFAHVTWQFAADRIVNFASARADLLVCALSAVALAALFRDWIYVLGYLACGPWLLLSLLAVRDPPGALSLYYGFPFVLAMFWPILALHLSESRPQPRTMSWWPKRRQPMLAAAVTRLTLAGLVGSTVAFAWTWNLPAMVRRMWSPPAAELQAAGLVVQGMIGNGLLDRESIGVDVAVASLLPKAVRQEQVIQWKREVERFDAVLFYATSLSSEQTIEALIGGNYRRSLQFGHSTIYAALRPDAGNERLIETLRRTSGALKITERSYLFPRLRLGQSGVRSADGIAINPQVDGLVTFGPYVKLSSGSYRGEYLVSAAACPPAPSGGRFELEATIFKPGGAIVSLARRSFPMDEVFTDQQNCSAILPLEFSIASGQTDFPAELLLSRFGGRGYLIDDIRIVHLRR